MTKTRRWMKSAISSTEQPLPKLPFQRAARKDLPKAKPVASATVAAAAR